MKHLIALVATILLAVGTASAQQQDQKTEKPKTTVFGEMATGTAYHLQDVGWRVHRQQVVKGLFGIERQLSDKWYGGFDVWAQRATAPGPNGAEEYDFESWLKGQLDKKTNLTLYAATYQVRGLSIKKFSVTLARDFKIKKQTFTVSNAMMAFKTSKSNVVPGGIVNKTELTTHVALPGKLTLSPSVAVSADNGPFGLGGPTSMGFLKARLVRPLNAHWDVFVTVRHSFPIAGDTIRRPFTSADAGFSFHYSF